MTKEQLPKFSEVLDTYLAMRELGVPRHNEQTYWRGLANLRATMDKLVQGEHDEKASS